MTKILTHNGRFHADEVFAIAMLKILFNSEIEVIRTRDLSKINDVDFVLDIGREYNPSLNKFDHHQETFVEKRKNNVPYATAGLIWKHFGEKITNSKEIVNRLDLLLIQAIDAIDNGVESIATNCLYKPYMLSDVIQSFRSAYNVRNANTDLQDFLEAVDFSQKLLLREISKIKANIQGEDTVKEVIKSSKETQFIILEKKLPWDEIVMKYKNILYVIQYNKENDNWSIYGVRQGLNSFAVRKPFPNIWGGKEGSDLEQITGVKGSVFCHKGLFLTVAKTKNSAVNLTKLALNS